MEMAPTVQVGDVVIAPQVRASHLVYVVHVEGGNDQLSYETRAEAVEQASAYARRRRVNAWYGDKLELGFVLLECFRDPPNGHDRSSKNDNVLTE